MTALGATGRWPALCMTIDSASERVRQASARLARTSESAARLRAELAARRTSSAPPASDPGSTAQALREREARGRVLLVEDDDDTARGAYRALLRAGFEGVERERSGASACRRLGEPWEAIVLDLDLGAGCSGIAVADEAYRRRAEHGARVVLWSGALRGADLEQARARTHAHEAVEKGGLVQELIAAIRPTEVERG